MNQGASVEYKIHKLLTFGLRKEEKSNPQRKMRCHGRVMTDSGRRSTIIFKFLTSVKGGINPTKYNPLEGV